MPRPKEPGGRRVQVCFKISQPEADLIDSLRGSLERGPWMRQAALSVARGDSGIPQPPPPKNCKHPKVRVKGVCPDCTTYVAGKP